MQVLKFGGSSVASAGAMLQVIEIVKTALETDRAIVVSSAISGCTDELIALGRLAAAREASRRGSRPFRKGITRLSGSCFPPAARGRRKRRWTGFLISSPASWKGCAC